MRTASHTCSSFDGLVEEAGENSFCRCVETWKTSAALFQAGFFYTGSIFKACTLNRVRAFSFDSGSAPLKRKPRTDIVLCRRSLKLNQYGQRLVTVCLILPRAVNSREPDRQVRIQSERSSGHRRGRENWWKNAECDGHNAKTTETPGLGRGDSVSVKSDNPAMIV